MFTDLINDQAEQEPQTQDEQGTEGQTCQAASLSRNTAIKTSAMNAAQATFLHATEEYILAMRNDPAVNMEETNLRFSTAMNVRKFKNTSFCVLGVGGIGTWVVRALVGMGAEDVTIIDNDVVEIHNVGPQAYDLTDIGKPKVKAMQDAMLRFRGIRINALQARVDDWSHLRDLFGGVPDVFITAVDNMGVRNRLGREMANHFFSGNYRYIPKIFVDLRMSLGAFNQYVLPFEAMAGSQNLGKMAELLDHYAADALFEDQEGVEEACTERALVYTGAAVAASTCALLHWINDNRLNDDVLSDFFNMDSKLPHHWLTSFNSRQWKDTNLKVLTPYISNMLGSLTSELDFLKTRTNLASDLTGDLISPQDPRLSDFNPCELEVLASYAAAVGITTASVRNEYPSEAFENGPTNVWLPVADLSVTDDMVSIPNCNPVLGLKDCIAFRYKKQVYGEARLPTLDLAVELPGSAGVCAGDWVFYEGTRRWHKILEVVRSGVSSVVPREYWNQFVKVRYQDGEALNVGDFTCSYIKTICRKMRVPATRLQAGQLVLLHRFEELADDQHPRKVGLRGAANRWCVICDVPGFRQDEVMLVVAPLDRPNEYYLVFGSDLKGLCLQDDESVVLSHSYLARGADNEIEPGAAARILAEYAGNPDRKFPCIELENMRPVTSEDLANSGHSPFLAVFERDKVIRLDDNCSGIYCAMAREYGLHNLAPRCVAFMAVVAEGRRARLSEGVAPLRMHNLAYRAGGHKVPTVVFRPTLALSVNAGAMTFLEYVQSEPASAEEPTEQDAAEAQRDTASEALEAVERCEVRGMQIEVGSDVFIRGGRGASFTVTGIRTANGQVHSLVLEGDREVNPDQVLSLAI